MEYFVLIGGIGIGLALVIILEVIEWRRRESER